MSLPVDNILHLIPQKPPFVMVSKLLSVNGNKTRSSFYIDENNVFVKNNLFQEAGLLENMAQTAALGIGYAAYKKNQESRIKNQDVLNLDSDILHLPYVAVGYIGAVTNLEIFSLPKVNDELVTETAIENTILNVTVISGKVWHNEELLAQCEMKVFIKDE